MQALFFFKNLNLAHAKKYLTLQRWREMSVSFWPRWFQGVVTVCKRVAAVLAGCASGITDLALSVVLDFITHILKSS